MQKKNSAMQSAVNTSLDLRVSQEKGLAQNNCLQCLVQVNAKVCWLHQRQSGTMVGWTVTHRKRGYGQPASLAATWVCALTLKVKYSIKLVQRYCLDRYYLFFNLTDSDKACLSTLDSFLYF